MRRDAHPTTAPLICELHSHTTFSDGELSLAELVDLHGRHGIDVLCVTDHVVRSNGIDRGRAVDERTHSNYLRALRVEAERAWAQYGMVLIPGLELTYNDPDPGRAAHALAVGLEEFVGVDDGPREAMRTARACGAAIIAAHPHADQTDPVPIRTTRLFWKERDAMRPLIDRYEVINRHDVYPWVAGERLPAVAGGDVHRPEHLWAWKTVLPCERTPEAIVAYLRSERPAFITRLEAEPAAERRPDIAVVA
jgi:predicted metal-dependent phosphoesterase TrpH